MKDTNAIEKALLSKIDAELKEVVTSFIDSINKLNNFNINFGIASKILLC